MGNTESGFTSSSTGDEVTKGINLEGKVVIITGANAGLGKEVKKKKKFFFLTKNRQQESWQIQEQL